MDASQARQKIRQIETERARHEKAILAFRGPLVAGSLVSRTTRCKRPGCRCEKGQPHGPFLYLSRNIDGRTRWLYIGKATQGRLAQAARRYKAFNEHVRALRQLAREADECYVALSQALCAPAESLKKKDEQ